MSDGVAAIYRTLEQELLALARGASLECLVCGEFVQRQGHRIACAECGSVLGDGAAAAGSRLEFGLQAG